jgi:hypothetical protein
VIAAAAAAAPAAAVAAGIVVRLPGAERHLSPEDVAAAADRPAGTYLLRAPGTTAEPVAHPPALSVRRLVTLAGASPDALSFVSIERPNGSRALLGRADLTDPPPFPEGPPIVWMDAGATRYLRPLRGPSDTNGADNVGITSGDLVVRVHQGPLLIVRARADRRTVPAGEAVHLTAEVVSGATPGRTLTFSWRFGDGATASGQTVRHAFREAGVYEAVVTVVGDDDSGGSSQPVRVRVGKLPQDNGPAGGGTGERRRAPAQGPARGSHGDDGSTTARPAPAPAAPRPVPAAPPAATTPAAPPAATPAPATPAAPARRATPRRRPAPKPRSESRRARNPARPRPRSGRLVRGTLVSARAAAALPASAPRPTAAARVPVARRGGDPDRDPIGPAAGILAALAGLGAHRERRALRPTRRSSA